MPQEKVQTTTKVAATTRRSIIGHTFLDKLKTIITLTAHAYRHKFRVYTWCPEGIGVLCLAKEKKEKTGS